MSPAAKGRRVLTRVQVPREAYEPRRPQGFRPRLIVLTRGARATLERARLVERICRLYPRVEQREAPELAHNRVEIGGRSLLEMHYSGKHTLVLGEHRSAVRLSEERGNTCPNYWHFSPYGFCPYDCKYCYLAATKGVSFSPTVKVFLNLPEMLGEIDRVATREGRPTAFYLGKLQDGLALDPLTGYSRVMVPFFARHRFARMTLLTKAADVANLLDLDHGGHTILSWSLNPPEVCARFETAAPGPRLRLEAMVKCAAAGYPVRAVMMPIIPLPGWRGAYERMLCRILERVTVDRITLGGICSFPAARRLMEAKLGADNAISAELRENPGRSSDGRSRYSPARRIDMYGHLIHIIRGEAPSLGIGLCLEEREVFEALGLEERIGKCNCVL